MLGSQLPQSQFAWYVKMAGDQIMAEYRGNRPTHTQTHPPTDRTDYNTVPQLASAQCNNNAHSPGSMSVLAAQHRRCFCPILSVQGMP